MSSAPDRTSAVPVAVLAKGRGRAVAPRGARALFLGLVGVVVLLVAWEAVVRSGVIGSSAFPPASEAIAAIPRLLASTDFWAALGQTLASAVLGIVISAVIALPLGTLIGLSTVLHRILYATIEFLKPIPVVALLPLALMVLGVTLQMKLSLIVFGAVWPLLIQVISGIRNVDSVAWNTSRSFRIAPLRRFAAVILPSAAPSVATGMRVAAVTALLLSVVTELVGKAPGIGYEISRAQSSLRYDELYAYIIVLGILGVGLNLLLEWAERRVVFWTQRSEERR